MINLTTAADVLNLVVVFALWQRMATRAHLDQAGVRRFFTVLLVFFFVSSAPLAVFRDPLLVGGALAFQHVLLMTAAGALVWHVLEVQGRPLAHRVLAPYLVLGAALTAAVLSQPRAIVWESGDVVALFRADFPVWVRLTDAGVLVTSGLVSGAALLAGARRMTDPGQARRTRIVAAGVFMIVLAPLLTYGLGATNSPLLIFLGSVVSIPPYFVLYRGACAGSAAR